MVKFALALKYWGQFSLGSIYVIKFIKSKNIFTCYFFHFKMTNKPLKEKESVKRPYLSFHFLKCGKRLIYTCKQKQLTCIGFFIFQTSFLGYKYCFFFFFWFTWGVRVSLRAPRLFLTAHWTSCKPRSR